MPKQVNSSGRGAERLGLGRAFEEHPIAVIGAIGQLVLPIMPAAKKAAAFSAITRESILRARDVKRADGAAFSRDSFDVDEITYNCVGYGHEQAVTKANRAVYANDFNADEVARKMVERILTAEMEKRVEAEIFNTTTWPIGTAALYTDVSTDWDDVSSTIIADVEGAKEKVRQNCGLEPNVMIVGAAHLKSFRMNTKIIAAFPGIAVLTNSILMSNLPAIFGIPRILIGSMPTNSGGEGDSLTMGYVWDDDSCWIGVIAESSDLAEPCVGRTMQWDEFGGEGYEWKLYTEPQTKTDIWQAEHWQDHKIIDPYFGHRLLIDS